MRKRLAALVFAVLGLLVGGAAPAAAAPTDTCLPPVIYPYCG